MEVRPKNIVDYETPNGKSPIREWIDSLDYAVAARIEARLSKGGIMVKGVRSHKEGLTEWLKKSDRNQREYLKASLEENSDMPEAIISAIRDIAEARGYEPFAKEAGLSKKALYKILDENKDAKPRFETIAQLIHALGLRFTVEEAS